MNEIWANRLVAYVREGEGKQWSNVPASRKNAVKAVLHGRVDNGTDKAITAAEYEAIVGEPYAAAE